MGLIHSILGHRNNRAVMLVGSAMFRGLALVQ